MSFVAAWVISGQSGDFSFEFTQCGSKGPKVVELPAIDFHGCPPLFDFDALDELADARQLCRIGRRDQFRTCLHLRLEKTQKAEQDGIAHFVRRGLLARRPGGKQHLPLPEDCQPELASQVAGFALVAHRGNAHHSFQRGVLVKGDVAAGCVRDHQFALR